MSDEAIKALRDVLVTCPFCGGDPYRIKLNFGSRVQIGCKSCGFYLSGKSGKLEALWNRRAEAADRYLESGAVQEDAPGLTTPRVTGGREVERLRELLRALCEQYIANPHAIGKYDFVKCITAGGGRMADSEVGRLWLAAHAVTSPQPPQGGEVG